MGAAGSVENPEGLALAEDAGAAAQTAAEDFAALGDVGVGAALGGVGAALGDGTGLGEVGVGAALGGAGVGAALGGVGPPDVDSQVAALVATVSEDQREALTSLVSSAAGHLSPGQMSSALSELAETLPSVSGVAILAASAGALTCASEMAPDAIAAVSDALVAVAAHLGPIGIACGAVGAIAYTFKLSKDQDENVKLVALWVASVRDWLLMVAGKIEKSEAESTVPLFKGLQDCLLKMADQVRGEFVLFCFCLFCLFCFVLFLV